MAECSVGRQETSMYMYAWLWSIGLTAWSTSIRLRLSRRPEKSRHRRRCRRHLDLDSIQSRINFGHTFILSVCLFTTYLILLASLSPRVKPCSLDHCYHHHYHYCCRQFVRSGAARLPTPKTTPSPKIKRIHKRPEKSTRSSFAEDDALFTMDTRTWYVLLLERRNLLVAVGRARTNQPTCLDGKWRLMPTLDYWHAAGTTQCSLGVFARDHEG